jgi:hypothetical protein
MIGSQVISTLLRQATLYLNKMWSGFVVSGEWLGISKVGCLDGETYFNLEINIHRDDRPDNQTIRFEKAEALSQNISGRYRDRLAVPI